MGEEPHVIEFISDDCKSLVLHQVKTGSGLEVACGQERLKTFSNDASIE
jgi:hypothetical protein